MTDEIAPLITGTDVSPLAAFQRASRALAEGYWVAYDEPELCDDEAYARDLSIIFAEFVRMRAALGLPLPPPE